MKYLKSLFLILSVFTYSQNKDYKDQLFKENVDSIVDELRFNYQYDQALREYILYKTFDKAVIDSLENLKDIDKRHKYIFAHNFKSDYERKIWDNFIYPSADKFTESLLRVSEKYGYPSLARINKYYTGIIPDEEFNPVIIFIHSNPKYFDKIKTMVQSQYEEGIIGKCDYGYIMWHVTGREINSYLDENNIKYSKFKSSGKVFTVYPCVDNY